MISGCNIAFPVLKSTTLTVSNEALAIISPFEFHRTDRINSKNKKFICQPTQPF